MGVAEEAVAVAAAVISHPLTLHRSWGGEKWGGQVWVVWQQR